MTDEDFIESEQYRKKDLLGFRDICLRQVQRITDLGSKEWRPGYMIYSHPGPHMSAEPLRYVGDTQKEYMNAIDILQDLVNTEIDKDGKEQTKKVQDKIEEVRRIKHKQGMEDLRKLYRLMFQELCFVLHRLGWLETAAVEESQ